MQNDQPTDNCPVCRGLGQQVRMTPTRFGQPLAPYIACRQCGGTGTTSRDHGLRATPTKGEFGHE
jgi:hypothetical protein